MRGYVGDPSRDCHVAAFVDADFCGEVEHTRSTSGMVVVLRGPNTWFPLAWVSKKQSSTARSTTEAELISAARAYYDHIIPLLDVFDTILKGKVMKVPEDFDGQMECRLMEDNQATKKIAEKGWSPKLAHVGRVHKVNIG